MAADCSAGYAVTFLVTEVRHRQPPRRAERVRHQPTWPCAQSADIPAGAPLAAGNQSEARLRAAVRRSTARQPQRTPPACPRRQQEGTAPDDK
jgi:hypothetical protein